MAGKDGKGADRPPNKGNGDGPPAATANSEESAEGIVPAPPLGRPEPSRKEPLRETVGTVKGRQLREGGYLAMARLPNA